jgi:glyoxylase I family protein
VPDFNRIGHLGLTVRDMRASAEWYQRVLGFQFVRELRPEQGDPGYGPRILLLHAPSRVLVGLCEHPERSGDVFSPFRTGLDHVALELATEDDLESWTVRLDALGVPHSPIREIRTAKFLSLEDPDGIPFELWFTSISHSPSA